MASTSTTVEPLSAMEESPNWLKMPHELMTNILQRLDDVEILSCALKVCTTWERIFKDPAIWKVINMHKPAGDRYADHDLEVLTKEAVDLSCGELIDISIKGFGSDELLEYILLRSSKLKSLCLESCRRITKDGMRQAVKRLPPLQKLHLFYTSIKIKDLEVIGQNCPQLKSFNLYMLITQGIVNDRFALVIANNMPELCHLGLFGSFITNNGLQAVLNGCPHLESLDVRECESLNIDGILEKLCMERIKDFKCSKKRDFDPWIDEDHEFSERNTNEDNVDNEDCGGSIVSIEDENGLYHYDYDFDEHSW